MRKLLKISLVCVTGAIIFTANPKTVMAYEEGVAGFVYDKDTSASNTSDDGKIVSLSVSDIPIPGYTNIGIAKVETKSNLLIRSGPGVDNKIIGKLPKDGGCEILEESDGWSHITAKTGSGTIKGYVKSEFLITGIEANQKAAEVGSYVAKCNRDINLNVRSKPNTDSDQVDTIGKGEELIVLDSKVVSDDPKYSEWVKVSLDSDEKDGIVAYVAKEFVDIKFELIHAVSIEELDLGSGDVSSIRAKLVREAKEHLGETYIYGRATLGVAVDCSGFMQQLYALYGYSIPRDSRSQARGGHTISSSELKPGDLVFYGSSSYISHVGMFIGNGQIIHASNHIDGIKISNMYYRNPVKYARYINN